MDDPKKIHQLEGELRRTAAQRDLFNSEIVRASHLFEEKVRELSLIRRIGDSLRYTRDVRKVFEVILDTIIEETRAENCSLMLLNRETGELVLKAARGQADDAISYYPISFEPRSGFRVGEGIAGWVAQHGEMLSIPDIALDSRFLAVSPSFGDIRSILCAPLIIDTELVGVVNLSHPRTGAFTPEDERLMSLITGQVALALRSVQVFDDLQRLNRLLEERIAGATASLRAANLDLEKEVNERRRVEGALQKAHDELEARVQKRTAELAAVNRTLQAEVLDRRRAEEELRKSEVANRALLNAIPDLMLRIHRDGTFLGFKGTKEVELYRPPDEFLGRKVGELFPPEMARQVMDHIERAIQTGEVQFFEYQLPIRGEARDFESRIVANGENEVLVIIRDISERKRAEEARRQAERELEAQRALSLRSDRLRSLGEMAAGIAHELNQPLSGVRGFAEYLLIGMDRGWELPPSRLREQITRIVEQADRMTHIIEHVRLFAREAGKPEVRAVQLNDVARSALDLLNSQFYARGLDLVCELADGLPAVSANAYSLEEVVLNLLTNARDAVEDQVKSASSRGGRAGNRVVLRTSVEGEGPERTVRLEVSDCGGGIPPDILPEVFDPFFTTKGPDRGTGLGLSISKAIVEQFGGRIEIRSTFGEGTTVAFSFPEAHLEDQTI